MDCAWRVVAFVPWTSRGRSSSKRVQGRERLLSTLARRPGTMRQAPHKSGEDIGPFRRVRQMVVH
jgi:hypothetical protein